MPPLVFLTSQKIHWLLELVCHSHFLSAIYLRRWELIYKDLNTLRCKPFMTPIKYYLEVDMPGN